MKITLLPDQLFALRILGKNGYRPHFYWDVASLNKCQEEVAVLIVALLRKRTLNYFGLKSEGLDFDIDGNPMEETFQRWMSASNSKKSVGVPDKGWDLFVNSLLNSVPNQPMTSWVGSDKEFLAAIQSVWDDIFFNKRSR